MKTTISTMKTTISALALATALSMGSAFAADLPSRKAEPFVPPPPPPAWTGFYAGLNAGYGFGTSDNVTNTGIPVYDRLGSQGVRSFDRGENGPITVFGATALANTANSSVNQSGFVGGGQVGYNYQFYQNFLAGIEVDIDGAGIRGGGGYNGAFATANRYRSVSWDRSCGLNGEGTCSGVANRFYDRTAVGGGTISANLDYIGTVRGRLGWLASPTLLLFGTGGLAYGGVSVSANDAVTVGNSWIHSGNWSRTGLIVGNGAGSWNRARSSLLSSTSSSTSYSDTLVGWTVGGGVEWLFLPNWSAKLEALYYDLGSVSFNSAPLAVYDSRGRIQAINIVNHSVTFDGVIARAGINYHFNWAVPAPVLAKY